MLPQSFVLREKNLLGNRYETLFHYSSEQPTQGITVNPLRADAFQKLNELGIPFQKSPFCTLGLLCPDGMRLNGTHPYHKAGAFYIQEPSASSVAELLEVHPGHKVLDLCAAPGGKSAQLAGALMGEGLLVSNEFDRKRSSVLCENIERMGAPNVIVLNETTENVSNAFPCYFDRVLVDAPCSGEGMFRKETVASTQYSPQLVEHCAQLGSQILHHASLCLKAGGLLVYSTCTFSPEEDESQIESFLMTHPNFELLELDCHFGAQGEENRCSRPEIARKVRRIWPNNGGEGHFIAKLRCMDVVLGNVRSKKPEKSKVSGKDLVLWKEFCAESFPQLREKVPFINNGVYILKAAEIPSGLHVVRNGVLAGVQKNNRFEPSHHLFMVHSRLCTNCESLHDFEEAYAYLRGEELQATTSVKGWCAVTIHDLPLGGGKNSAGVVKNHLPKGLRNLK